jgi:predicted DNA-binding transcriptional regulator AlpA
VKIRSLLNFDQEAEMLIRDDKLLTTKQLPAITGLSESYFEKGRIYGFGPPYLKLGGRVIYRLREVLKWMSRRRVDPEGPANV